jgi:hypothetical protein
VKKVVYIISGLALAGLLLVGGCAGLFFYVKNQEENAITSLFNEKPVLQKHLGVIEQVNVDLTAQDKRETYDNVSSGNKKLWHPNLRQHNRWQPSRLGHGAETIR